jgi:hypothetical protein
MRQVMVDGAAIDSGPTVFTMRWVFDQILADPKIPPQMARHIARLQLPVLRAALGDPTFFSSRRHPVRRLVNRIASLGAGFEDFGDDTAKSFLAKVRELVQQVVEGDFEQIDLYERNLAALEAEYAQAPKPEPVAEPVAVAVVAKPRKAAGRKKVAALLAPDAPAVSVVKAAVKPESRSVAKPATKVSTKSVAKSAPKAVKAAAKPAAGTKAAPASKTSKRKTER